MSVAGFDWDRTIVEPVVRFDRSKVDAALGAIAAIAVALPVALAVTTDLTASAVMVALGAFNLFLGAGGMPTRAKWRATGLSWGLNAVGLGLGTLVAVSGELELVWIAAGIAALSSTHLLPSGRWAAVTSAVLFAIGVGLPNASVAVASARLLLVLLGGAWAVSLSALVIWVLPSSPPRARRRILRAPTPVTLSRSARTSLIASGTTGVAAALAFALGLALGLPRDYWTMLTVIVVFQTGILAAISTSAVRVAGTLVGAAAGGALAAVLSAPFAWIIVIGGLAGGTLAVRPASSAAYTALLTPFVIVLLSLSFPAGWSLAEGRVIDTLLGAGCALVATETLCLISTRAPRQGPAASPSA